MEIWQGESNMGRSRKCRAANMNTDKKIFLFKKCPTHYICLETTSGKQ